MFQNVLSWLLHHANRLGHDQYFYSIKNRILTKYGVLTGYDVQFIEGKKCHSCGGTGTHYYYDWYGEIYDVDSCWHCYKGWYKRPTWNILKIVSFGKNSFHQPYERVYKEPLPKRTVIEGYIEHTKTKYSKFALTVLFLLYEKGYIIRWYKNSGLFWNCYWWKPYTYLNNIIHILKNGIYATPIKFNLVPFVKQLFKKKQQKEIVYFDDGDLPF